MRGDRFLPQGVGNYAADVEDLFRTHMVDHGFQVEGFTDDPARIPDGHIDGWPVDVKAVSLDRPDADSWSVNVPSIEKYDQIPGLIIAILHPHWSRPMFVSWKVAREHLGPERPPTTSNRGGRYPYHWVRLAHAHYCRACDDGGPRYVPTVPTQTTRDEPRRRDL